VAVVVVAAAAGAVVVVVVFSFPFGIFSINENRTVFNGTVRIPAFYLGSFSLILDQEAVYQN